MRGAQFVLIGIPTILRNTLLSKRKKNVVQKNINSIYHFFTSPLQYLSFMITIRYNNSNHTFVYRMPFLLNIGYDQGNGVYRHCKQYFSYFMAVSFIDGGNQSRNPQKTTDLIKYEIFSQLSFRGRVVYNLQLYGVYRHFQQYFSYIVVGGIQGRTYVYVIQLFDNISFVDLQIEFYFTMILNFFSFV